MIRVTKKLWNILETRQHGAVLIIAFLMLVGAFMESLSVSLILPLISAVMSENAWSEEWYAKFIIAAFKIEDKKQYIIVLLILLIAIFVIKNVYLIFEYYVQYSFIAKSRYKLQKKLMSSYTRKPYDYYLNASSGEIVRIVIGDTNQTFSLLTNVLLFYTEIIVSIVLGVTIFIMSPAIAIGLLVILSIEMIAITKLIKPIMNRMGDRQRYENAMANKWLLQAVNGIKSIKVTNKEDYFENQYSDHAFEVVNIDKKNQTLSNIPRLLIEAFTVAGILIIILIMILAGTELAEIVPQLSAFVVASVRMLPSVNRVSSSMNQTPFLEGGLDNVINTLSKEEPNSFKNKSISQEDKMSFEKEMLFSEISYSYPNSPKLVFDRATFSIRPGQSVGFVGTSGAGKTTAVDILLGLLAPSEGKVLIDGIEINRNLTEWHKLLSYIPQTIFLLDDSIKHNVAFGIPDNEIDEKEVARALEEAQMLDFVNSMSDGVETVIGEQGIRLSGGQRQRIGIARALYSNPQILFFDEATSALDNETEAAIMEAINQFKGIKTLVIVAHRLSTIEKCDVVFHVEDGKVREELR